MHYFDIILFALIAVFLALRLRSILGSRDGFDGRPDDGADAGTNDDGPRAGRDETIRPDDDNVIHIGHTDKESRSEARGDFGPEQRADASPAVDIELAHAGELEQFAPGPLQDGIKAILDVEPGFTSRDFVGGAKMAFEMILSFYSEGNEKSLKPLLSAEVFADFQHAIRERDEQGQTLEETLIGISTAEIVEAYVEGDGEFITVKFVSEQISALRNADGTVIEGDPARVDKVTDFWTFSRSSRSSDPNWVLVATGSLD